MVEDHLDMQKYIEQLLAKDFKVIVASDGKQALKKLINFKPDLIISDVRMPGMDGLTFAKKIKENTNYRLIPFITLTAHSNKKDKLTALRIGVDDYLIKPFNPQELLVRVNNLINNAIERNKEFKAERTHGQNFENDFSHDEKVILDLEQTVRDHISDSSFNISTMAQKMAMSESTLNRIVKRMTGFTPGQFIREIRLQQSIHLLEAQQYATISEVVYEVGFQDVSSFSRLFKNRFGKSPSKYVQSIK